MGLLLRGGADTRLEDNSNEKYLDKLRRTKALRAHRILRSMPWAVSVNSYFSALVNLVALPGECQFILYATIESLTFVILMFFFILFSSFFSSLFSFFL